MELRFWQRALNGFQVLAGPALFSQEALEALAGVKMNVGLIQQPLRPIEELTGHQFGDQTAVGDIRNGKQHTPCRGEQLLAFVQHTVGLPDMLEHVCADDDVVTGHLE